MRFRIHLLITLVFLIVGTNLVSAQVRHEIPFPDLPGFITLKCDLHTHTVFSDGTVWPTVRIDEAWRLGLDVIAISDHIEYQPHRDDVPTNHNRPYALAAGRARQHNLLFPRATEITRDTPPGHFNVLFLNDIDPLDTEDLLEVIELANDQGAFVFWNHHDWRGEERGGWMDIHTEMYENNWLHGMEVANGPSYYPRAHQWCLDRGLTMVGTSDIHQPDLNEKSTSDRHRTMTLAFVRERTLESLHEALMEGRTAVWYADRMIGRSEYLEPLFEASIEVLPPHMQTNDDVWFRIKNHCAMDIHLRREGLFGPAELNLPAMTTTLVRSSTPQSDEPLVLTYTATGFWIAPETGLPVTLVVPSAVAQE